MYNKTVLDCLIKIIGDNDGIADKKKLAEIVKKEFNLVKDRSVYYCDDFAIRFSQSRNKRISFSGSDRYHELKKDLDDRVAKVQGEIAIAAFIDSTVFRTRTYTDSKR